MKKFTRLISFVVAMVMASSLMTTGVFATETSGTIIELMDFGNPANFEASVCTHPTAEVSAFAYPGKSSSLKYTMSKGTNSDVDMLINTADRNLSQYNVDGATINVRFYSEAAGSSINLLYWKTNAFSGNYYPAPNSLRANIVGGWQTFSVPFKDVYAKTGDTISMRINDDGWTNTNYNEGETIYVDSVWIDTAPVAEYDPMNDSTSLIVWNCDGGDGDISNHGTNKVDGNRGKYRYFNRTSSETVLKRNLNTKYTHSDSTTGHNYTAIFNTTGYDYINAWVYSPKAQDSGFNIRFFTDKKSTSSRNNFKNATEKMTADVYDQMVVQHVNWEGWNIVSIPIDKSQDDDVITIEMYVAKQTGSNYPEANVNVQYGIDAIWLSKGETSPAEAWEASKTLGTIPANPYSDTDISIVDYNKPSAVTETNRVSIQSGNTHLYDMSARISWPTMTVAELKAASTTDHKAEMTIYANSKATTNTITGLTDNSYINLWVYNPEVKYAYDGTSFAEFLLVPCYYDTANSKMVRKPVAIMANWTGWKLISIPVKDISADLVTNGMNHIYLSMNAGWYPYESINYVYSRTDDQKAKGYAAGGGNPFAGDNTQAAFNKNRNNYIDIERVWISDGPVSTDSGITAEEYADKICPQTVNSGVKLFDTDSEILKLDINTVKTVNKAASVAPAYLDDNNALILDDGLEYGAEYAVYADIYTENGVKNSMEFTFTTEDYHVSKTENGDEITITMHGNIPADYANAVMVAAVYNNTGELDNVTFETVENNTVTVKAESYDPATQTIKFIFLNGWNGVRPLAHEIVK